MKDEINSGNSMRDFEDSVRLLTGGGQTDRAKAVDPTDKGDNGGDQENEE